MGLELEDGLLHFPETIEFGIFSIFWIKICELFNTFFFELTYYGHMLCVKVT